jgi:CxxC motif-containing protein (DUF1111 family)
MRPANLMALARLPVSCVAVCFLAGAFASTDPPDETLRDVYPGTPVPGLSLAQLKSFDAGSALFARVWHPKDGLGRYFNATSCAQCHHNPLPGGNEFAPSTFVAHSMECKDVIGAHSCSKLQLVHGAQTPETRTLPRQLAMRKPQSLFGLGMLEAVSDETLLRLAQVQETDPDGVRGMVGRTNDNRIGRFGWKARFATIDDFVAAAFRVEFGMTSSLYPGKSTDGDKRVEVPKKVLSQIADFTRYLAAPPVTQRGDVSRGKALFAQMRCTACHVPSLPTKPSAVHPLGGRNVYAYSDMLLHDMGEQLSDGISEGRAGPGQFRTPPLWGLNASGPPYLHDGRAKSLAEAIALHGGEAQASAERFRGLATEDVDALLRFLSSL